MADKLTIARPYAKAAFAEARTGDKLGSWSDALHLGAAVVSDARVKNLLGNPHVTPAQLAQLIIDVSGAKLDENGRNFISTLSQNGRLAFLPEIATLFDEFKDQAEGVVDVTVTSAAVLDDRQKQALSSALERKLKRAVRMQYATDPKLIGGAVLRAGDLVIDGSVRARLERIAFELTA